MHANEEHDQTLLFSIFKQVFGDDSFLRNWFLVMISSYFMDCYRFKDLKRNDFIHVQICVCVSLSLLITHSYIRYFIHSCEII